MGGVEVVEDMADEQVLGQAGGPTLRACTALTATHRTGAGRRAASRLRDAVLQVRKKATPLKSC